MGDVNSAYNKALKKCEDLMRQKQSISTALEKQSNIQKKENHIRLSASIDVARLLLHQRLAFHDHNESDESSNKGNFKLLLDYTADQSDIARKVVLKNAPKNNKLNSPSIQKDIVHCFVQEVVKFIFHEIGDDVFALLVDESNDISNKEQVVVILRYVDKYGEVKERIVGLVHVTETFSSYLKSVIDSLFAELGLSLKKVRGQGYDETNNMRGEFNGLRALITRKNNSAYYVHCFAHQLRLVVVAIARKHVGIGNFFDMIGILLNVVSNSCKTKNMILESHLEKVQKAIGSGEIEKRIGLNQELTFQRPGDTRRGSHYKTLLRVVEMYSSILDVLENVENEGKYDSKKSQAHGLQVYFQSFDFVFYLHLMMYILGLIMSLSMTLQRRYQDILEAMLMVASVKRQLQNFREDGWDSLLAKISSFCEKNDVPMLKMEDNFVNPKRQRQKTNVFNLHHYLVNCFYTVVDLQFQEFNDRFNEVNTELLTCIASLDPKNSFQAFSQSKLMRLSEFYLDDFSFVDQGSLEYQLILYIDNMRYDGRLVNLESIGDFAKAIVKTKKYLSYPLVYRFLKLALTLPVMTATIERCFFL